MALRSFLLLNNSCQDAVPPCDSVSPHVPAHRVEFLPRLPFYHHLGFRALALHPHAFVSAHWRAVRRIHSISGHLQMGTTGRAVSPRGSLSADGVAHRSEQDVSVYVSTPSVLRGSCMGRDGTNLWGFQRRHCFRTCGSEFPFITTKNAVHHRALGREGGGQSRSGQFVSRSMVGVFVSQVNKYGERLMVMVQICSKRCQLWHTVVGLQRVKENEEYITNRPWEQRELYSSVIGVCRSQLCGVISDTSRLASLTCFSGRQPHAMTPPQPLLLSPQWPFGRGVSPM